MAETWNVAFGRYLRTLRERRQLSLQSVSSLSQAFAETVNKGYLSRCENGRQRLALSKVIPLGRIYGVPADVLIERLELDLELDRVGAPDTEGMDFAALTTAARQKLNTGSRWEGYAFVRESIRVAETEPNASEERIAWAFMNCATAARGLGRRALALHEYLFVESTGALGPTLKPILFERMSHSYRNLKDYELATRYADKTVEAAEISGDPRHFGLAFANRAHLALDQADFDQAITFYRDAYEMYDRAGYKSDCVRCLNNLAQIYFDRGRLRASRRMLLAAEKATATLPQPRAKAIGRLLMGEIDLIENKPELATMHWKEAASIARGLNDKLIRFKAEYLLFKHACDKGDRPVARALHRRLLRLANWIPADTPELGQFHQHLDD